MSKRERKDSQTDTLEANVDLLVEAWRQLLKASTEREENMLSGGIQDAYWDISDSLDKHPHQALALLRCKQKIATFMTELNDPKNPYHNTSILRKIIQNIEEKAEIKKMEADLLGTENIEELVGKLSKSEYQLNDSKFSQALSGQIDTLIKQNTQPNQADILKRCSEKLFSLWKKQGLKPKDPLASIIEKLDRQHILVTQVKETKVPKENRVQKLINTAKSLSKAKEEPTPKTEQSKKR